uniref:Acyltransferase 3 domain-containing protein n=1 Tax=Parascaris univalens TaxID=6257 RepID=A0A915AX45_PARUN
MPKDRQSTITCMFGIRFLTILWIIVGHSFAWIEPYLDNPVGYRRDIAGKFLNQWISNFLLTVDTFLVLGGTVNAYWLEFYRHRIVRLWPAYLYTLLGVMFLSSSHYHALWPELDPLIQCRQHWKKAKLELLQLLGRVLSASHCATLASISIYTAWSYVPLEFALSCVMA